MKLLQKVINLLFMEEIRESEDCFVFPDQSGQLVVNCINYYSNTSWQKCTSSGSMNPQLSKTQHKQQQVVIDPNIKPKYTLRTHQSIIGPILMTSVYL